MTQKNRSSVTFRSAPVAYAGDAFSENLLGHLYPEVAECGASWMRLTSDATDAAVVELFAREQVGYPTPPILMAALAGTTDRRDTLTYMASPLTGAVYWVCSRWSTWMTAWDISAGEVGECQRRGESDRILGIRLR